MEYGDYIICVDDDEDDCDLLNEALKSSGRSTVIKFFHDGDDAISFIAQSVKENRLPKLIILDINIPKMNGLEILPEIRKVLPDNIPVLFLTTTLRDSDIAFSEQNNAAIMAKPTSTDGYTAIVETIFTSVI
jgi:CheY-like chemotaxis protein